jgi:hypothetical protein
VKHAEEADPGAPADVIELLRRLLPKPVVGSNPLVGGSLFPVIAVVGPQSIVIYEHVYGWTGPGSLGLADRSVGWVPLPPDEIRLMALIRKAARPPSERRERCLDCGVVKEEIEMGGIAEVGPVCYACMGKRGHVF